MNLTHLKELPPKFFDIDVIDIEEIFKGPTLIHLNEGSGRDIGPVVITVLLHGNEHSGFYALQRVLKIAPKREIIIFIANPMAAAKNTRFLCDQLDFNRVWSGGDNEQAMIAQKVLEYSKAHHPFLSIDIHNNSGKNPFYSCINRTDDSFLSLAKFFSPYIVYFTEPHEVQSMAFSKICPAVTIEAGQSGNRQGIETLERKLLEILEWRKFPEVTEKPTLFHTMARIRIPPNLTFDFDGQRSGLNELSLRDDIEDYNFRSLPPGFILGATESASGLWLEGDCGNDIFDEYLAYEDGELIVKKAFIPAMLTTNKEVIAKDCFGYLMKEFPLD